MKNERLNANAQMSVSMISIDHRGKLYFQKSPNSLSMTGKVTIFSPFVQVEG